jgi:hypothetical protein
MQKELLRTEYGSFEHYCRDKWQYSERYAYQLISVAQVFQHLSAMCTFLSQSCRPSPDGGAIVVRSFIERVRTTNAGTWGNHRSTIGPSSVSDRSNIGQTSAKVRKSCGDCEAAVAILPGRVG